MGEGRLVARWNRRGVVLAFLAGGLCALLGAGCASGARKPAPLKADTPRVKVMTYNVNFGIPGEPGALEAIRSEGADVVLLQETTPAWEVAIRGALKAEYPHMEFRHCCGAGGLAVLSKRAFRTERYVKAPKPGWFPAWVVRADTPVGAVQLLNVHLRPPVSDSGSWASGYFSTRSVRVKEITAYQEHLDVKAPVIVAGDFNESASGSAVKRLERGGLRTVLPEYHGSANTWRWETSVVTLRAQLDHIVYDRARLRAVDAYVVKKGRSDHFPVVGVFALKTAR